MNNFKSTLFLYCLFFSSSFSLIAQDVQITESTSLYEQIENTLAPLDMSVVTTQILYDKGMDFYDWSQFGDNLPPDSLATDANDWGWHFAQVASSCINDYDPLPATETYMDIVLNLDKEANTIPIASMLVDYHYFHPDALSLGLLTYDTINETFHDVSGQNPYLRDTFFIATLLGKEVYAGTINIVMPDSLQMGNLATPASIAIDIGTGWMSTGFNQSVAVSFTAGMQYISLRYTLADGSEWYSKTGIKVLPPPPPATEYSEEPDESITAITGATLNIFYGNDCGDVLLKPFIFIEGFNPNQLGNVTWEEMQDRLDAISLNGQNIVTPTGNSLWQDLDNEGYDLIYVDFDDGAGDMFANAIVVENIINWVNTQKSENESIEQNMIMGVSMGGVVGYRALRTMEVNNVAHETEYFITFDAPLRGANIAIGLQYMIKKLGSVHVSNKKGSISDTEPALKLARDVLLTPTAKQMLYFHAYAPISREWWHDNFFNALHADGPLEVKHIAISNGSAIGEIQPLNPGEQYFDLSGKRKKFFGSFEIVYSEIYALNHPAASWNVIYKHKIKKKVLGIARIESTEHSYAPDELYDSAPGGNQNFGIDQLLGSGFEDFTINNMPNKGVFGFIPTVSALNLPDGTDPMVNLNGDCNDGGNSVAYRCVSSIDNNTTSPYTLTGEHNQNHVSLNSRNATFLLNFVKKGSNGSDINPLTNRTYNFGKADEVSLNLNFIIPSETRNFIDYDLIVEQQGQLWVNRNDRIDFTDISNHFDNKLGTQFDLIIRGHHCDGSTEVLITNGGRMEIGQQEAVINGVNTAIENSAIVSIEEGGTLTIGNNGIVVLDQNSKIFVKSGGILNIENGGTLRAMRGAKIIVEEGGILEINQDANIDLWYNDFWYNGQTIEGSSIRIKDGGELVINGSFNFDGSGFFEFDEGNITTFNAPFELSGNGKTDRFIRLNDRAVLEVSSSTLTEKIILTRGLIEYLAGSSIKLGLNGEADMQQVTFDAQRVENDNTGIIAEDAASIFIQFADFNNFDIGIAAYSMNLNTDIFKLTSVNFNDCYEGIVAESCKYLDLGGVHFSPYDDDSFAMWLWNVEKIDFGGSISEYGSDLGAIIIYNDLNVIDPDLPETILKLSNADLLDNEIGIYVSDDSRADILVTNGSLIDGNNYGIKATGGFSPAYANVTVNRGATISNNQTGIFIAKGSDYYNASGQLKEYGTVEMTCAKLLDNTIGVDGEDLWLNIDACVNSGQTTASCDYTQTYPNHFKSTSIFNKLFRICYAVRTPIPIEATGNYWDLATNTTVPDYISIDDNIGAGCSGLAFDYSNAATAAPTKCEEISIQQLPNHIVLLDSLVTGGGSSITCLYSDGTSNNLKMNIQYINAYADYMEEDYTSSANLFLELANISDAAQDAYCTPCQHYINIARSRTFYTPNVPDAAFSAQIDNNINQNKTTFSKEDIDIPVLDVKIFPNPTYGELNIKTNSEQSIIRIIDLHGRVKVMLNDGLDYQINTQSWAAGIYIVEITDQITMEVVQRRIVVQP